VRKVSLIEITDNYGRTMPTIDARGFMPMGVPITENIKLNDVEQWDIINTTVDAHPMHLHQVAFQLIDRVKLATFTAPVTNTMTGVFSQPNYTTPALVVGTTQFMPDLWEAGWKDTIDCPPGWVTRVRAKFDIEGLYVWHCHILSHEEHDMMRSFKVHRKTTVGVFRGDGQWFQDTNNTLAWDAGDTTFKFGSTGDKPFMGDWSGSGTAKVGVFRGDGLWYLDLNGSNAWDAGDVTFKYGSTGDIPVAGDWTGNGITKVGVFRNGVWYLDSNNTHAFDAGDAVYTFGAAGDTPVTGDWDGSGKTRIGVFKNGKWWLDMDGDGVFGASDISFTFGSAGDIPITGDWDQDGTTEVGVIRGDGTWFVDTNKSRAWDAGDQVFKFGSTGDLPVTWK
jgi:hypothetical protein